MRTCSGRKKSGITFVKCAATMPVTPQQPEPNSSAFFPIISFYRRERDIFFIFFFFKAETLEENGNAHSYLIFEKPFG